MLVNSEEQASCCSPHFKTHIVTLRCQTFTTTLSLNLLHALALLLATLPMLSKLNNMTVASTSETPWDLWIDYQRRDDEGLTHGDIRHARAGLVLEPGMNLIVGNEDANSAVAEVVRINNGIVFLRINSDLVTQPAK